MINNYFRPRNRFDFSDKSLDIGNPITWSRSHFLKHLFKKIFSLKKSRFLEFYQRHLNYYLTNFEHAYEEMFFKNLFHIVDRQLRVLKAKDVYADNHVKNQRELQQLSQFADVLISLDLWNEHKANDSVVAKQESEILALKQKIELLKTELKEAKRLDTSQYIDIAKGGFLNFIDLINQLQELKLSSGRELVFSEFPIVWVKLICRFFREDHKEIEFDRVRRYFPKDKRNPGNRSSSVPLNQHLFEIRDIKKLN